MPIDLSRALEAYVRAQTLPSPPADKPADQPADRSADPPTVPGPHDRRPAGPAPAGHDRAAGPVPESAPTPHPTPAEPQADAARPAPDVPPEPPGAPLTA
ncbi:hypothetical protein [Streptomyces sp. B8F3]|uniref:hypothetical protein n=1 Tax=unclassified Streptomyces TaxID=2593676 RepID=UPI00325C4C06